MSVFADLTPYEYRTRALGYKSDLRKQRPLRSSSRFIYEDTVPAKEVNWVDQGAVTPVCVPSIATAA